MEEYVPIQKKKGATNDRKEELVLDQRFPRAEGEMTAEETLDYEAFKLECTPGVKKGLEETDDLVQEFFGRHEQNVIDFLFLLHSLFSFTSDSFTSDSIMNTIQDIYDA